MSDPLPPGEIHVWSASLAQEKGDAELLPPDELQRGERLLNPLLRRRFFVTRLLVRHILASYLPLRPEELRFLVSPAGKPALVGEEGAAGVRFNITHSGDLLLVAVCRGREVGVDVEEVRPDTDFPAIAGRYFSPAENAVLLSLPPAEQAAAFYRCWTRKEAYLKGRGSGFLIPFDRFSVTLAPGDPAAIVDDRTLPPGAPCWRLADLAVPAGFVAAAAAPGAAPAIVYRDYSLMSA